MGQSLAGATQVTESQSIQEYDDEAFQERNFSKRDTNEHISIRAADEQFGGGVTMIEYRVRFDELRADADKLRT